MSQNLLGSIYIKSSCAKLLKDDLDRIAVLFSATLSEKKLTSTTGLETTGGGKGKEEYDDLTYYDVTAPIDVDRSTDFINRVQVRQKKTKQNKKINNRQIVIIIENLANYELI